MENMNRSNIALPSEVSGEILQKTQEESAIMRLARRVTLPGRGLTIPVITGDPTAEWVGETGVKPVSNPSVGKKIMQAYKIAVIETFSEEFTRDYRALYDALIARIPRALASTFDKTAIGATAVPGENFDTFAACTAQSIAGNNTYAGLVAADADISDHLGILNGYALAPQAKSILLSAVDGNKRPLFINNVAEGAIPMILGAPTYFNRGLYKAAAAASGTQGQDDYVAASPAIVGIAGDWTQAMYGTVEGVKVSMTDNATVTSGSGEDAKTINLWQQNMVAVRAEIEIGFRADTTCFNLLTGAAAS